MSTFYVAVGTQHTGPFTLEQLAQQNLTPETLVWNDTMPNWTPAGQVAELRSLFYAQQPTQTYHQQPYQQEQGYQRPVGFGEAIGRFFSRYAEFYGRSSRSEFWFAWLFTVLVNVGFIVLANILLFSGAIGVSTLLCIIYGIFNIAIIIPQLAICWRRLHDTGRSGGWWFIGLIPLIGSIILLVYFCQASQPYENEYGEVPNVE